MQVLHGGAAAKPFKTHHNALDMPLFMRIAPELYLKRLLVGGFPKVFELNRNFRNEGISPRHNPEFTMLEAYEAYGSWETMADMVEGMICHLAETLLGGLKIEHKNATGQVTKTIDLTRPWRRVSMADLVYQRFEVQFFGKLFTDQEISKILDLVGREERAAIESFYLANPSVNREGIDDGLKKIPPYLERIQSELAKFEAAEQLVYLYEKFIEPKLKNPTFVTQVPSVVIPLAKKNKENPFFADVYELAINGQEISPGYSELNDPAVQEENFRHQVGDKEEQQAVDEDFLNALKYGMPPAGGMGMGIDRLIMMLTGAESIRDVILFPLMRPNA
jgi:lysyl-tRNA synthetase, class II